MKTIQLLPLVGILGVSNIARAGEDSIDLFAANLSSGDLEDVQATYSDSCGQFTRARLFGPLVTEGKLDESNVFYQSPSLEGFQINLLGDHFFEDSITRGTGFLEYTRDGEALDLELRAGGLLSVDDETSFGTFTGGRVRTNFLSAELDAYAMPEDLGLGARGFLAGVLGGAGKQLYFSVGGKTLEKKLVSTAANIHPEGEGIGFYNQTTISFDEDGASASGEFAISTGSFNRNTLDTRTRIYNGHQLIGANTSVDGRWGYAPFTALGLGTLDVKWNSDLTGSVTAYAQHMDTGSLAGLSFIRTKDEEGIVDLGVGVTAYLAFPLNEDFTVEAGGEVTRFRDAGLVPAFAYLAAGASF